MKTKTDPKALMTMNSNLLRSAADRMGKEVEKQIGDCEEKLHFKDQKIAEGKRTRTIYQKESFARASMKALSTIALA